MWSISLLVLFMAAVVGISLMPVADKHLLHTTGKYHFLGHLLVFSCLGMLAIRLPRSLGGCVLIVAVLFCFGVGVELAEHVVYRDVMEWYDVVTDSIGVLAGAALSWVALHRGRSAAGM